MDSTLDFHGLCALLQWQVELGIDEAIGDVPINRYEAPAVAPKVAAPAVVSSAAGPAPVQAGGPLDAARRAARKTAKASLSSDGRVKCWTGCWPPSG